MNEQIKSIRPSDLRDYLRSQGWTQISEAVEDNLYVLNGPKSIGRQIIFPTETTAVDYWDPIAVSLEKLSEIYDLPISSLAGKKYVMLNLMFCTFAH